MVSGHEAANLFCLFYFLSAIMSKLLNRYLGKIPDFIVNLELQLVLVDCRSDKKGV